MINSKQIITIIIITAIISSGLGFWIGKKTVVQKLPANIKKADNDTFQSGWEAAKQRLKETGYFPTASENVEIKSVSGEVTSVEGNKIALKIRPLEPLADPKLDNRIVLIDSQTKFIVRKNKSAEQTSKEMEEYTKKETNKTLNNDKQKGIFINSPVAHYYDLQGTMSNVKKGSQVFVVAENNIKDKKQFKATKVIVLEAKNFPLPTVGK